MLYICLIWRSPANLIRQAVLFDMTGFSLSNMVSLVGLLLEELD